MLVTWRHYTISKIAGGAHAVIVRMRRLTATLDCIEYGCRERDAVRSAWKMIVFSWFKRSDRFYVSAQWQWVLSPTFQQRGRSLSWRWLPCSGLQVYPIPRRVRWVFLLCASLSIVAVNFDEESIVCKFIAIIIRNTMDSKHITNCLALLK